MTNIDIRLFYLINKSCANPVFDFLMPWVSRMGGGICIFIAALVLLCFKKKECRIAGIVLLAGLTVSYYLSDAIKGFIARPRPFTALADARILASAGGFAFPSTHAAQAFMAATVLSQYFKRYAIFFSLAVIVAFSRVYLGVHYVSDVAAGAALGIVIGYLLVTLQKKAS
jgi:undecaprenyl-diphosphatase